MHWYNAKLLDKALIAYILYFSQTYTILKIQLKTKPRLNFKSCISNAKRNFIGTYSVFHIQLFNSYNLCLVVTTENVCMCDLHQDNQYILLWTIIPVFGICCSIDNLPASWNSYGNPRFIRREFQAVPQISGYKLYRTVDLTEFFFCRCSISPWVAGELENTFNFL